jgi:hypothetical protein
MAVARLALSCLDRTDLSDNCGPADIQALCWRAQGSLAHRRSLAMALP